MKRITLAVLGIAVSLCLAGSAFAAGATKDECVAKSKEAAAMVNGKGLDAAVAEINKKDGKFVWKDSYVFLMDLDGKMLAHPLSPALIGKNVLDMKDKGDAGEVPLQGDGRAREGEGRGLGRLHVDQSGRSEAAQEGHLYLQGAGEEPVRRRGNLRVVRPSTGSALLGYPRCRNNGGHDTAGPFDPGRGDAPPALYPPASFAVKPRRKSSARIVSRWSPWISITPPFAVPPVPQRRFRSVARFRSASPPSGTPDTVVTVFPPRPFVSRRTRTIPSPAGAGSSFPQRHFAAGRRHVGQTSPRSVE